MERRALFGNCEFAVRFLRRAERVPRSQITTVSLFRSAGRM
jgi:hypothetical protein